MEQVLRAAPIRFRESHRSSVALREAVAGGNETQMRQAISRALKVTRNVAWKSYTNRKSVPFPLMTEGLGVGAAVGGDDEQKEAEETEAEDKAMEAEMERIKKEAAAADVRAAERAAAASAAATAEALAAGATKDEAAAAGAAAAAAVMEAGAGEEAVDESDKDFDTTLGLAHLFVALRSGVSHVAWHPRGDYFATVSPTPTSTSVVVHRLSRAASQLPFSKSQGLVQRVGFHPFKPHFIVALQTTVRIFNLGAQSHVKTLQCPTKWVSSVAVHPSGDHILVGGYDRRVAWFDLDLSSQAYRTLKYHQRAVRSVAFHSKYPLFASGSDDGCLHVVHGTVYDDLLTNPLLVPVKIINAHVPVDDVAVHQVVWHPQQPWLFSCATDTSIRLWS